MDMKSLFIALRALTYASLFIGLVLVFVPARIIARTGIATPPETGLVQVAGIAIGSTGAALAVWCVVTFVGIGRGTPAPFDPPRRLVTGGPYRFVRNPMYIGATLALAGAALFYRSWGLATFAAAFWAITHLFVRGYEEPTLERMFGDEYAAYQSRVRRWWPRVHRRGRGE
jgi:protein-S-isoprenylcysteine O-methyltransferase Ste14